MESSNRRQNSRRNHKGKYEVSMRFALKSSWKKYYDNSAFRAFAKVFKF